MQKLKIKTHQLLRRYSHIMKEMRKHGILRSHNNPVGDLGEVFACEHFGLTRAESNTTGFDATDKRGKKYEIKSRRVTPENMSLQLGALRNLGRRPFDFLVFVIFDLDFVVKFIGKAPIEAVIEHGKYIKHTNSWKVNLTKRFLSDERVKLEKYNISKTKQS